MDKKKKSKKKAQPVYLLPVLGAIGLLAISLCIFLFWQYSQDSKKVSTSGPQRILLLGNDLFVHNDVPNILRQLYKSSNDAKIVEIQSFAIPDRKYSLGNHLSSSELSQLAKSKWDFVVLQDSDQAVIESPYEVLTNVRGIKEKFKSSQPKFVFVCPFAEKGQATRQKVISAVVRKMCKNLSVENAPLGDIFLMTQSSCPDLSIYNADKITANSNGSFIIASTIYSAISGNDPKFDNSSLTYSYGGENKSMVSFSKKNCQIVGSIISSQVRGRSGKDKSAKPVNGSYSLLKK